MKTGMRTISGVSFLISEIVMFEQISTNIVANPIDIPLRAEVVVPKVGHMPSRRTKVGFSLIMPLSIILIGFIALRFYMISRFRKSEFSIYRVGKVLLSLLRCACRAVSWKISGNGLVGVVHCVKECAGGDCRGCYGINIAVSLARFYI